MATHSTISCLKNPMEDFLLMDRGACQATIAKAAKSWTQIGTWAHNTAGYIASLSYILCFSVCMLRCFSHVRLCATLWNATCQAPLSIGFSRQEHSSGLPCPPPGDLSTKGLNRVSYVSCIGSRFFTISATWKALLPSTTNLKM